MPDYTSTGLKIHDVLIGTAFLFKSRNQKGCFVCENTVIKLPVEKQATCNAVRFVLSKRQRVCLLIQTVKVALWTVCI